MLKSVRLKIMFVVLCLLLCLKVTSLKMSIEGVSLFRFL